MKSLRKTIWSLLLFITLLFLLGSSLPLEGAYYVTAEVGSGEVYNRNVSGEYEEGLYLGLGFGRRLNETICAGLHASALMTAYSEEYGDDLLYSSQDIAEILIMGSIMPFANQSFTTQGVFFRFGIGGSFIKCKNEKNINESRVEESCKAHGMAILGGAGYSYTFSGKGCCIINSSINAGIDLSWHRYWDSEGLKNSSLYKVYFSWSRYF